MNTYTAVMNDNYSLNYHVTYYYSGQPLTYLLNPCYINSMKQLLYDDLYYEQDDKVIYLYKAGFNLSYQLQSTTPLTPEIKSLLHKLQNAYYFNKQHEAGDIADRIINEINAEQKG